MLDYLTDPRKKYGSVPKQVVLYIGREPLKMPNRIDMPDTPLSYEVEMIDLGNLNAEELLNSHEIGDVILAILNRHADPRRTLTRILERLKPLEPEQRLRACRLLVILSAKRNLSDTVIEGVKEMAFLIDPMEDTFFCRLYEKGLMEGEEKGLEQGIEKGEARFLLLTLRQRFGPLPAVAEEQIKSATSDQLESWITRILTANTLNEVLNG